MSDTQSRLAQWAPQVLAVLRVITGLLFIEHGTAKLFDFPQGGFPGPVPELASLLGAAALFELIGGALIVVGLFIRPVAFLLSGEMAVAYFTAHATHGFFPILNHG